MRTQLTLSEAIAYHTPRTIKTEHGNIRDTDGNKMLKIDYTDGTSLIIRSEIYVHNQPLPPIDPTFFAPMTNWPTYWQDDGH